MTDSRANKGTYRKTRSTVTAGCETEWHPLTQPSRSSSPTLHEENEAGEATLHSILKVFRRDNNQQLVKIKQELHSTNKRLEEAGGRIEEAKTALQAMAMLIKKLMNRQASMEAKLTDQEPAAVISGYTAYLRRRREITCAFLEKLLSDTLDIHALRIERAYRSQAPPPGNTLVHNCKVHELWSRGKSYLQSLAEKGSVLQEHLLHRGSRLPIRSA